MTTMFFQHIRLQYAFPAENSQIKNFFAKGFRGPRNATKILKLFISKILSENA